MLLSAEHAERANVYMESMSLWFLTAHEADTYACTHMRRYCLCIHYVDSTFTVLAVTGTVHDNCIHTVS